MAYEFSECHSRSGRQRSKSLTEQPFWLQQKPEVEPPKPTTEPTAEASPVEASVKLSEAAFALIQTHITINTWFLAGKTGKPYLKALVGADSPRVSYERLVEIRTRKLEPKIKQLLQSHSGLEDFRNFDPATLSDGEIFDLVGLEVSPEGDLFPHQLSNRLLTMMFLDFLKIYAQVMKDLGPGWIMPEIRRAMAEQSRKEVEEGLVTTMNAHLTRAKILEVLGPQFWSRLLAVMPTNQLVIELSQSNNPPLVMMLAMSNRGVDLIDNVKAMHPDHHAGYQAIYERQRKDFYLFSRKFLSKFDKVALRPGARCLYLSEKDH